MDGKRARLIIGICFGAVSLLASVEAVQAEERVPDLAILEWLGQSLDAREAGVSIDALLDQLAGVLKDKESLKTESGDTQ